MISFVATNINHLCALLVVVCLLGALRFTWATRSMFGHQFPSQFLLIGWLALLIVTTYMLPGMSVFAVGLVVPLFADSHLQAWAATELGAPTAVAPTAELVRKCGQFRFIAMGSIGHLLRAGLALIIVSVSVGRNSWEYWLGAGMLCSAFLGVLLVAESAWRVGRVVIPEVTQGAA